jgi:hypothetical protein
MRRATAMGSGEAMDGAGRAFAPPMLPRVHAHLGRLAMVALGAALATPIAACAPARPPAAPPAEHLSLYNEAVLADFAIQSQQAERSLAMLSGARVQVSTVIAHAIRVGAALWVETHPTCPTASEVLGSNAISGHLSADDAWEHPFNISCPSGRAPEVRSAGPDGLLGTDDDIVAGDP